MKDKGLLLAYLEKRASTPSDMNEHLKLLYEIVVGANAQRIVELGTRGGNSTCALVIGASETGGHVVSVDHGKGTDRSGKIGEGPVWEFLAQTADFIRLELELEDFWTLVIKDDVKYAREYEGEIDLLFIDTNHSYDLTKKELATWGKKVVSGGFILLHDTVSFPGQNRAILEFIDEHPHSEYVEHKNCNGLGIIIKGIMQQNQPTLSTLSCQP